MEGYVWDVERSNLPHANGGTIKDRPLRANDDLTDATRYFLVHTREKRLGVRLYT